MTKNKCEVVGCEEKVDWSHGEHGRHNKCGYHYRRWLTVGTQCKEPNCDRRVNRKGWCLTHSERARKLIAAKGKSNAKCTPMNAPIKPVHNKEAGEFKWDKLKPKPNCEVEGCDRKVRGLGKCYYHWRRWTQRHERHKGFNWKKLPPVVDQANRKKSDDNESDQRIDEIIKKFNASGAWLYNPMASDPAQSTKYIQPYQE